MPQFSSYDTINSQIDPRERKRQNVAIGVILCVLALERLAFYALSSSFVLFLNEGPWDEENSWNSLDALKAIFALLGISYATALIGGYIADAWLGRYKSILFSFALYIIGYFFLTLSSVNKLPGLMCDTSETENAAKSPCKYVIYIIVTIIGIGSGTFRSNIVPFGREQLRYANASKVRSFFNWFYWCINFGSLMGIGVIAYIEQDNPGVCTNGFFCGYTIATVCLLAAALLFVIMSSWFYKTPPEGSLLLDVVMIIWEALVAQCRRWKYKRLYPDASTVQVEPPFLDRAKIRFGGSFHEGAVNDVRSLGKVMSILVALIPYWIVYFQMESTFQIQGLHMRLGSADSNSTISLFTNQQGFHVPAAWLTLFNQAFLFFAIPVLTNVVYPKLDRAGVKLTCFFKIGIGMVFATIAVTVAGGLESYRLFLWNNDNGTHIDQIISNTTYHAVDISIFWQVPQYMLIGAAESFASIAGLEYANSAAPTTFQGLIMGLLYCLEGCASFLGSALLGLVSPYWFNNMKDYANINDNHLDFYLYFLAIIQFLTFVIFGTLIYIRRFSLQVVVMPPTAVAGSRRDSGNLTQSESDYEPSEVGIIT